jgi:hypothetical protein
MNSLKISLFFYFLCAATSSAFASNYDYNKLRFMEYNEFRQIKNSAINASRKFQYPRQAEQTIKPLKEALKMLYSTPNTDNLVSSLITDLESELETLNVYEKTLQDIIDESIKTINDKSLKPEFRTTAALCIKNLLLEAKPKSLKNTKVAKVICKLADNKIKIPADIQENSMYKSLYLEKSPTDVARKIMLWYADQKKIKVSYKPSSCPFSKRAI